MPEKRAKPRQKWIFYNSIIEIISKLKILVLHIILCHSRDFALPKTQFLVPVYITIHYIELQDLHDLREL